MKNSLLLMAFLFTGVFAQTFDPGTPPPPIELKEKLGGRLDGNPWTSEELKGKTSVIFYVDPDHKDDNEAFSQELQKRKLPLGRYQSIAIINLKATWLPNFAIEGALKKKQKKYAKTLYLKDYKKHLVKEWGLKDNSNNVLIFSKEGVLLYFNPGTLDETEIQKALSIIEESLS